MNTLGRGRSSATSRAWGCSGPPPVGDPPGLSGPNASYRLHAPWVELVHHQHDLRGDRVAGRVHQALHHARPVHGGARAAQLVQTPAGGGEHAAVGAVVREPATHGAGGDDHACDRAVAGEGRSMVMELSKVGLVITQDSGCKEVE